MSRECEEIRAVYAFSDDMRRKLKENRDKPLWDKEELYELYEDMVVECHELLAELLLIGKEGFDPQKVIDEAADVGNFSMMIADNARKMLEPNTANN